MVDPVTKVDHKVKIVLIPARSGSKRLPDKNVKLLNGHPLMAYAISAALDRGFFDDVFVSSDSSDYLSIAEKYGAKGILRPSEISQGDIKTQVWVEHVLKSITIKPDIVVILRPTNPFIGIGHIHKAMTLLARDDKVHSIRSIRLCSEHPYKMWRLGSKTIIPAFHNYGDDYHNMPTQQIPHQYYIQTGGMEIFRTKILKRYGTQSGRCILPYILNAYDGFDIHTEEDLLLAEILVHEGKAHLPKVSLR